VNKQQEHGWRAIQEGKNAIFAPPDPAIKGQPYRCDPSFIDALAANL